MLLFWGVALIPLFTVPIMLGMAALGALWSPAGGLICRRMAKNRGLNGRRYFVAGSVYSILFVFPWFYLVSALRGRPSSARAVRRCYVLLYSAWLLGPIAGLLMLLIVGSPDGYVLDRRELYGRVLMLCVWVVMVVAWGMSLLQVRRLIEAPRADDAGDLLPDYRYILPFALALASAAAFYPVLFVSS